MNDADANSAACSAWGHLNSTFFPAIAVVSLDVQMAPTSPGTSRSRASASASRDNMEACSSGSASGVYGLSSDFCKKVTTTSLLFSVKSIRSLAGVAFRRVGSTRALHQLYGLYA
ncbi:hypothetical protein JCM10213_004992 [Rhodosporidiobolus nylandii]